ncbi:MAG: hypothetical protein CM15mV62_680 [uncultured marine virus]|nr:MAG: hypothetical protein CM15mV62_680 [uncultured marine virus]
MSRTGDWFIREEEKRNGDDGYDRYIEELEWAKAEEEFEALERARDKAEHIL